MKKQIKMIFSVLLFVFVLMPAINVQAETLNKPTGINLNTQSGNGKKFQVIWNFDGSLKSYHGYGYEVQVTNVNDKELAKYTYDSIKGVNGIGMLKKDASKCGVNINVSKLKTSAFKVKIKSYIYDANNQYTYSPVAEKVIVPRATVTKLKDLGNGKAQISWTRVTGAKNYTVYSAKAKGKGPGSFKKIASTKKTSTMININKLARGDNYVYVSANGVKCGKNKYNSTKPVHKNSNTYVIPIE